MKNNKSIYNTFVSIISQTIILSLGLIVPRIILVNYGSDTNGLTSTITQIFTYVALLEAGIGQATRNALFPFLNGDKKDKSNISAVMSASKKYYRRTTFIYGAVVLLLAFVLPFVIKSNVSKLIIFFVVFFEGLTGVVSFYFIQYWSMLLAADGKSYVTNNIELFSKTLCYIVKIVLALNSISIVYIQAGYFIVSLLKLLLYRRYVKKHYSWIESQKVEPSTILKDRYSYVVSEIAWTVFSSTDMIILSICCSTVESSVYYVYNMVFVALNSLLNAVYQALLYILGQNYHSDLQKYSKIHDVYNSVFIGSMTALMSTTYVMILPFVSLYTKGITDVQYIYKELPIMFCLIQLLSWSRYVSGNLSGIAGYAKKVSRVSLIEAIINIVVSLIFVRFFGVFGVLVGTVFALPLKAIYLNILADKVIMKRSPINTIKIISVNFIIFLLFVLVNNIIVLHVYSYISFIIYGFIVFVISVIICAIFNFLANKDLYSLLCKSIEKHH